MALVTAEIPSEGSPPVILKTWPSNFQNRFGHDRCTTWPSPEEAAARGWGEGHLSQCDFTGLVYRQARLPRDLFTPILRDRRVAGWAGPLEGAARAHSDLRPPRSYTGQFRQKWVPWIAEMPRGGG